MALIVHVVNRLILQGQNQKRRPGVRPAVLGYFDCNSEWFALNSSIPEYDISPPKVKCLGSIFHSNEHRAAGDCPPMTWDEEQESAMPLGDMVQPGAGACG